MQWKPRPLPGPLKHRVRLSLARKPRTLGEHPLQLHGVSAAAIAGSSVHMCNAVTRAATPLPVMFDRKEPHYALLLRSLLLDDVCGAMLTA